jgi:hypothetical protein
MTAITTPARSTSRRARGIRRAAVIAGFAGAVLVALPTAAMANTGWGGTLSPGATACVGQQANYRVRGEGYSGGPQGGPLKYTLYKDGVVVDTTPAGGATAWAAERRTEYGNFPGAGFYTVCAKNNKTVPILTNIRILVDTDKFPGEF